MPIDFAAIAKQFAPQTKALVKVMALAFERLGAWLKPRFDQIAEIERLTRPFPVLRFYNGALTAAIDASQHRTLTPLEPSYSALERFGNAGRRFVGGFEDIGTTVRSDTALYRLMKVLRELTDALVASVQRYQTPTPEMFNPNRSRHVLDIFGQGVLFLRASAASLPQLEAFRENREALQQAWAETWGQPGPGASAPDNRPTFMQIDDLTNYLVLGILAIPLLGRIIHTVMQAAFIRAKLLMLDILQGIEHEVFALRRAVIGFFAYTLYDYAEMAITWAYGIRRVVVGNLRFYLRLAHDYLRAVLNETRRFIDDFGTWINQVLTLLQRWLTGLDRILDTEILDPIVLITPLPIVPWSAPPTITLRDLLTGNAQALGVALVAAIRSARSSPGSLSIVTEVLYRRRLDALERIILIVTNDRLRRRFLAELTNESVAFRRPHVEFPNIYDAFFGPDAPDLGAALTSGRDTLRDSISNTLGATTNLLRGESTVFETAASRAAVLSQNRYMRIAQTADQLVVSLFSDQAGRPAEVRGAALAFQQAFMRGGFSLIGEIILVYVAEMDSYWQSERTSEVVVQRETPTSPHILARRERLGRVETSELVIRVPQRPMDGDLQQLVLKRFSNALSSIYMQGLEQHQAE
jgi:hypothetical protein